MFFEPSIARTRLEDKASCPDGWKGAIKIKTIEAFFEAVEGSAALQDELKAVKDEGALAELLKKHDVGATVEEFANAVRAKTEAEGEISDEARKRWRVFVLPVML